ncbi:MAG: cell wall hydrolase [Alphaproteobacteria bacterium]|nr:cell wall hydrolase [Alphaproteobacteria bacterium]
MKQYIKVFLCTIVLLISSSFVRASSELDLYSVAATLYGEAGCLDDQGITMVAETIRNRYNFYNGRKKVDTISLRDVVIAKSQYLGFDKYKNKSVSDFKRFENSLSGQAKTNWNRCMAIAQQVANGTLNTNYAKGTAGFNQASVSYNKKTFNTQTVFADSSKYYGSNKKSPHVFIGDFVISPLISPSGKKLAAGGMIGTGNTSGEVPSDSTSSPAGGGDIQSNADEFDDDTTCGLMKMKKEYLSEDAAETVCWYCKIVIVMTNAYLEVASKALPVAQSLGSLILKLGFAIWLGYFILQQVSSINPITPGKMLQEVLGMGFKVALASLAVASALTVISTYFLTPLLSLSTDYGIEIMKGIHR